jgi:hypothetical protein
MKTFREVLLARHRTAESRLDVVRERAVAAAATPKQNEQPRPARFVDSCREFFRIPRLAWAGLAAAWAIIIALNIASSETPPANTALAESSTTRRSPEMLQALREQKRLFAELIGAASEKADAEAPRFVPRPRSEGLPQSAVA